MSEDIETIKKKTEQAENFIIDKIKKEGKFIDSWGAEWTGDYQGDKKRFDFEIEGIANINEIKNHIESFDHIEVSPEEMTLVLMERIIDLIYSYTPEKELFRDQIEKIIKAGPPYSTKQIEEALLFVAYRKYFPELKEKEKR
jgi:hypothetical protein